MGGGYISCGDFWGDDKSGSAYQGVLEAVEKLGGGSFAELAQRLRKDLDEAEFVEIDTTTAKPLLPAIAAYRADIEHEIGGPRDPFDVIGTHDKDLDPK